MIWKVLLMSIVILVRDSHSKERKVHPTLSILPVCRISLSAVPVRNPLVLAAMLLIHIRMPTLQTLPVIFPRDRRLSTTRLRRLDRLALRIETRLDQTIFWIRTHPLRTNIRHSRRVLILIRLRPSIKDLLRKALTRNPIRGHIHK